MISRRRLFEAALGATPLAAIAAGAGMCAATRARAQTESAVITVTALDEFAVLGGSGCNVVACAGRDGALMIDGGLARNATPLLTAVADATGTNRVDTLINTHWHPEQTGANTSVGMAGGTIFAHEKTAMYLGSAVYSALFDGRLEPLPEAGRPNRTARSDGTLDFDGRRVDYGYLPAAHTDGDLYVHFPDNGILVAGGVTAADRWPLLDHRNGAWFGGRVRALQWLAELVEPATRVVPAHGPLLDGREIVRQRDICLELFETLIGFMNRGFGPEDAAASDALAPYTEVYGDPSEFLYGAYRSMLIAYVPD